MKDHFEEITVFHMEVDEIGEHDIYIHEGGSRVSYDKVNVVIIEHGMFIMGQLAARTGNGEEYVPVDMYPLHAVSRIENQGETDPEVDLLRE